MTPDGFVLAGGRSTRMGTDKARLPFPDGWPMATAVAGMLATRCDRVVLVRRGADDLPWPRPDGGAWEVVRDAGDRAPHPLEGLATACTAARTRWLIVVPCDVPFLPAEAVDRLVGAAARGPVVAACGEQMHPLIGYFPKEIGASAARAAAEGASVRDFLAGAARVALPPEWVRNVNRWEDTGRVAKPLEALAAGLPWVQGAALERLIAGEVTRLAARGAVAPG